jgi:alginate O-acetyltransferase complex protein AlgI
MIFTSYTYVAFLLLAFVLHWSIPARWRQPLLIVASYVFYCSWQWQYGFLLLGVTLFNWSYGRWVLAGRERRFALSLGVLVNLTPLFYFKYTGFALVNLNTLAALVGAPVVLPIPEIVLPLGISFFTFQGIAYLVDVAAGDSPIRNLGRFMLYKAFWPQLIAGPIIRPEEIHEQLVTPRTLTYENVALGCRRILTGFCKKIVLADTLAPIADVAFLPGASVHALDVAVGAVAFGLQIYFDFSAYSDIAIGSARLFGYVFPENFHWPYLARSPQEFWNRWHMTLSRWIRDYVFTPLTFAHRSRPALAHVWLIVAMAGCGLWHGAQWTFVCWGLWHGVLLVANQTVLRRLLLPASAEARAGVRDWFGAALTFAMVTLGWILFRAQNLGQVGEMLESLVTLRGGLRPAVLRENAILIVAAILLSMWAGAAAQRAWAGLGARWAAAPWLLGRLKPVAYALMIVAVIIFDREAQAFVYFQF